MKKTILSIEERFKEIYKEELDSIFKFCLARTSDIERAYDFSQDVFLRFWKALSQNQIINNPRSFLYTVARNIIIDGYRKKKTTSLDSMLEDASDDKSFLISTDSMAIETEAEAGRVTRGIEALEKPYRDVLHLRFIEGFKPREIAKMLDESANVVSVRISRGVQKLKKVLGY